MKTKQRKGATLGMVIIATIFISIILVGIAFVVDTGSVQTLRTYRMLQAKYLATSGSQLAMGAYFGEETPPNATPVTTPLFDEFASRASGTNRTPIEVKSTHQFEGGKVEIMMTGDFQGAQTPENYYVTVVSKAPIKDSNDVYVHEVEFNQQTSGIRSERTYLE